MKHHRIHSGHTKQRLFRASDFGAFGDRFDIDFRYPDLFSGEEASDDPVIARGDIVEHSLGSGFRFTFSDIEVLESYETESLGHAPLLMLMVLKGKVALRLGVVEQELSQGMAVSMQLHPDYALTALQHQQRRLQIVTLAFDPRGVRLGHVSPTLSYLIHQASAPLTCWTMPLSLQGLLTEYACHELQPAQRDLVLEGLALQLVGLGSAASEPPTDTGQVVARTEAEPSARPIPPVQPSPQRQRLELVRQHLEFSPHQPHSLDELARMAAMSPSSLRAKFRATYGMPVFDYLRKCRLNLARQYLQQGYTVQQTANKVGYNHATNFATAYRRAYGVSPKASVQ